LPSSLRELTRANPDLQGRIVSGYDFANLDGTPEDDSGHGTQVSGIIGATGITEPASQA
jgi:subtilisin family serine protease